ncbi:hypothetical protein D3C72_1864260 [compost metagenome]
MVGTRRHFKAWHQLPVDQFTAAVVQAMVIRINGQHFVVLWEFTGVGSIVDGPAPVQNDVNGQKGIDVASLAVRISPSGAEMAWCDTAPAQKGVAEAGGFTKA